MNTKRPNESAPDRTRLYWMAGTAALLGCIVLIVWWPGFRHYPAVTSAESLKLMKALYAACNTRDSARLAKVAVRMDKASAAGLLTESERKSFTRIIAAAQAGDWSTAEKASFRFAQDQVGVGHAAKAHDDDRKQPETRIVARKK